MYYLRSRAAADAIKFTVDTSLLKVITSHRLRLLIFLLCIFILLKIFMCKCRKKRSRRWVLKMTIPKWLRWFALLPIARSAWLVEVKRSLKEHLRHVKFGEATKFIGGLEDTSYNGRNQVFTNLDTFVYIVFNIPASVKYVFILWSILYKLQKLVLEFQLQSWKISDF